jgi:outer membrane receptor protein involved in Fe transport
MIIKKVLLSFCLMTVSLLWSQSFTVSGKIIDQQSNPVAYTNILLLQPNDSLVVSGTTSDDNGRFSFSEINKGTYIIKATFISYEESFTNIVVDKNIDVGNIVLKESVETLSEVELVYERPTLDRKVDRLVFNVEKTALSEGTIMDVLRNTPSVLVLNDAITVKGSVPIVYINDRRVHISTDEVVQLLEGTTASNIKSVEVITNPSAKYDAESGVVINIVMSKNLVSGYNGSVFSNVTQGVFPKSSWGTSNYFKGKNIGFFANYIYNDRKDNRNDRETIQFPSEKWVTALDRNTWSETHNFSMNFDWDIAKRSTVSVSANTQFLPYFRRVIKGKTDITPVIPTEIADFYSNSISRDKKQNMGFDLDFVQRFKDEGKLSFNTHYTTYDFRRNQNVATDYFLGNNSFSLNNTFKTRSDQDTKILTSQVDLTQPAAKNGTFEIGTKYTNITSGSGISRYDLVANNFVLNQANTDLFDYKEEVLAAYISLDKNWENWSLSLGLRVEDSKIEGLSVFTNQLSKQDYFEWFPTLNLGIDLSEKTSLYFNYKRSIDRPNYSFLNPFRNYYNDNVFVTGNPDLKPVFIDQYRLETIINNVFTIGVYYQKRKNNIFELPFQDNVNNTLAYSSVNINHTNDIGFDVEAAFNVTDRWFMYLANSLFNYKDKATLFSETVNRDKWANYSIFQNNWSFLKDNSLTANFTFTYVGANVQGLQNVGTTIFTEFSVRKTIFKGKGVLSLAVSDLLNRQNWTTTTEILEPGNPFYQNNSSYIDLDDRYVRLGFRYNFGNSGLSTNERSTTADDRDRLKNEH